ncbi:hypothetical protein FFF34_002180 [Inquilinus sp. KBS0705]|nr:hypothetical protein FFF34_002180 [Inquilinus sp. KBS0705]
MLKRCLLFFTAILLINNCFAQETVQKKNKLTDSVTEVFQVLKSNKAIRQGLYQALFKKKITVASGDYKNDKRAGLWQFYDTKGTVIQTYNYDTQKLYFEAPEDTTSALRYFIDKNLEPTDKVTKPIKIGGRYYGYIPYLQLFKLPDYLNELNRQALIKAVVELLISPYGRLADYKVHLFSPEGEELQIVNMNIDLPNPADKIFTPTTLNGEAVSSRIMIRCFVTDAGHLDFDH